MRRSALVAVCGAGLLLGAPAALGAPGLLRLSSVAEGSEWVGWNQSGVQQVVLPRNWSITSGADQAIQVKLTEGATITLPTGTRLRAVGFLRANARAPFCRGRHARGGGTVTVTTRHLAFQGGAVFQCPNEAFGPRRQAVVSAVELSKAVTIEVTVAGAASLNVDRIQWSAPSARAAAEVDGEELPGMADDERPEEVVSFGLWSPEGVRVTAGGGLFEAETARVGWCQVNGRAVRTGAPTLDVPRGEVWIRQATLRSRAQVALTCRLAEPTGALAQGLRLAVSGAPGVVMWSAADSPAGLDKGLAYLAQVRSGGDGEDRLTSALREVILPTWYGLWYNSAAAREEVREQPTLDVFVASYRSAVASSRPKLVTALNSAMARAAGTSLAKPADFTAALGQVVDLLAGTDRRAAMWYSVYLSDVLSDLARRPLFYQHLEQRLEGAAASPARVTLAALRSRAADTRDTGVLRTLQAAPVNDETVGELTFARLGPGVEVPIDLIVEVGRSTPVGTYQVETSLSGAGADPAKASLRVHVRPSYGHLCLLALCWLAPTSLLIGLLAGLLRRRPAVGVARGIVA